MIPEDFKDYFVNCCTSDQQSIISSLLSISTTDCNLADNSQQKAVSCPHCNSSKIRANGKLKGV